VEFLVLKAKLAELKSINAHDQHKAALHKSRESTKPKSKSPPKSKIVRTKKPAKSAFKPLPPMDPEFRAQCRELDAKAHARNGALVVQWSDVQPGETQAQRDVRLAKFWADQDEYSWRHC
jgi:hypothetical protein